MNNEELQVTANKSPENAATSPRSYGVSIIIPVHNPGEFLRQALESVHAQTYADWELIVVDDNSSEDLSWIGSDFPRARLMRQAHGGASVARNNGILNSSAPLIAFMDQDDLWRPQKLQRQVAAMNRVLDAAVCYCDLELIGANDKFAELQAAASKNAETQNVETQNVETPAAVVELDGTQAPSKEKNAISNIHRSIQFFSSRFIVPSTVLMRRSALSTSGLLDPFIPFSGDYDLLIKLGGRHKILHVPAVEVLYRKHANNFSDQYQVGRQEVNALVARYAAYAKSKGDRRLEKSVKKLFGRPRKVYAAQAFDNARKSLRARDYRTFAGHFTRAIYFSPAFVFGSIARGYKDKKSRQT